MGKKKNVDDWGLGLEETNLSEDMFEDSFPIKNNRLSRGRVVWTVFVCLFFSCALVLIVMYLYISRVSYPPQEEVVWETTGMYCLQNWEKSIQELESTGEDSYIHREIEFANGSVEKLQFYKKMLSTVSYSPLKVVAKNIYGNDMIDKQTKNVVKIDSYVEEGEEIVFTYIDYSSIDFAQYKGKIKELMKSRGLSFGSVDYENKLVYVFLDFMNWLPEDEIPLESIERVPYMNSFIELEDLDASSPRYFIGNDEDIYIDKLLFSSNDFYDCMDRFSEVAASQSGLKGNLTISNKFIKWDKLSDEEKETTVRPSKYSYKECCSKTWCGTYYLLNEYSGEIEIIAEVGDGSFNNPAGYYTDIVTSVYYSEKDDLGNITSYESYPIRVTLKEYGVSQDAIDWFESKDDRNRGINLSSDVQYCYMVFEITNLSDKELTISENMGLCDKNGNVQARTGIIYGLQFQVTLKPDEVGYIETWQSSTELYKKYVIWGADFARREEPVWFRLLAGDLENEDEFKGVTVNTSRQ